MCSGVFSIIPPASGPGWIFVNSYYVYTANTNKILGTFSPKIFEPIPKSCVAFWGEPTEGLANQHVQTGLVIDLFITF